MDYRRSKEDNKSNREEDTSPIRITGEATSPTEKKSPIRITGEATRGFVIWITGAILTTLTTIDSDYRRIV